MSSERGVVRLAVCLALAGACLGLYSRTFSYEFVNFDDFEYVANNPRVTSGLRPANIRWALTAIVGANWHPLTMLTHMADCQVYGTEWVGGHHLTNALLHAANAVLLLLALEALTGRFWPSALVAAVFAVHPLRVESVAWISERKDVLCAFFWLIALWFYAQYARRKTWGAYLGVTVALCLGLLSKPMIVTAPALFLVLDFWPLRRFPRPTATREAKFAQFILLIREKLPWFALVFVSSTVTFIAQSRGAVHSLESLGIKYRIRNTIVSYGDYLVQFVWPTDLAAFYPHPTGGITDVQIARAAAALVSISLLAWMWRHQYGWILSGWLWYLGTLVPAIGLVQVGGQARADRYTYIPLIGVTIIVAWALAQWVAGPAPARTTGGPQSHAQPVPWRRNLATAAVALWLVALSYLTWVQTSYWQSTKCLFQHALDVTGQNFLAYRAVGNALAHERRYEEAIDHFDKSLKIMKLEWPAACSKGWAYYMLSGDASASIYQPVAVINVPFYARAAFDELARKWLAEGVKRSTNAEDLFKVGLAELRLGNPAAAAVAFEDAIQKKPDWPDAIPYLIQALNWSGRPADSREFLERRLARPQNQRNVHLLIELAWLLATSPDPDIRDPQRAYELAEAACAITFRREARSLDARAAALASLNRFSEALDTAETAARVNEGALKLLDADAERWQQHEWLDPAFDIRPDVRLLGQRIAERVELYRRLKPYRQDPSRGRF